MKLTPEELEKFIDGMSRCDITKNIALPAEVDLGEGRGIQRVRRIPSKLEQRILEYMRQCLPELGIKRDIDNFFVDHPVKLLMDADAQYVAGEANQILSDKGKTDAAVIRFLKLFRSMIKVTAASYCKAKGKKLYALKKEDYPMGVHFFIGSSLSLRISAPGGL